MSDTPYAFFLSYSRHVDENLVAEFFDDLDVEVRLLLGRDRKNVGFLDREGVYPGDDWKTVLIDRARTARSMIALLSTDYGKSGWCGREWGIFAERIGRVSTDPDAEPARCLIPLRWSADTDQPEVIARLQNAHRSLGDDLLIDLKRVGGKPYLQALKTIAGWIVEADRAALPPLDRAEAVAVRPAFGDATSSASPPPLPLPPRGTVPAELRARLVRALYMVEPLRNSGGIHDWIKEMEIRLGPLDIRDGSSMVMLAAVVRRAIRHPDAAMLDEMTATLEISAYNDPALPRVTELVRQIKELRHP
ncbi:TIR domain-containing protein [Actinomadura pelletieri DSM 43383]|uniref:TIR domain-containing protein n=1 Tax=Actinomadura pelletieri DSM 43383 TaxID=1120940 RepID=A0A495R0I1_9ACTN|nr:toll/interleukin-1 receptor domain-containing protein [Actinomadura pelletieri]RKS79847.1 TIR domain-containing protein [Actinomadura pelletieri DSM 43383]